MSTEFLEVIAAEEAQRRIEQLLKPQTLGTEWVPLTQAWGRIVAEDIEAPHDVPGFDRSNVDGFALQAASTFGASEEKPALLKLNREQLSPGVAPTLEVVAATATPIATGGMLPRGADAVVMREYTHVDETEQQLHVQRPATPGALVSFTGSDLTRGERVVAAGVRLTSRETGTLAAVGVHHVPVTRRPRVALISTGNEIIAPDEPLRPGLIHDSNQQILADAITELGGTSTSGGIVGDNPDQLEIAIREQLATVDMVVLSGGTSKGQGDYGARVLERLGDILFHGVALKPGKPICFATTRVQGKLKPIVILPGFPTSAVFTFHEFVAPLLRRYVGDTVGATRTPLRARVPMRLNSDPGRAEFFLVSLSRDDAGWVAYPMGKGSGSITAFSRADGYLRVPRHQEFIDADSEHDVTLIADSLRPADLTIVGSHCIGLDLITRELARLGYSAKTLNIGSQAGLLAAQRGECDAAGIHLCDESGRYNEPFVSDDLQLLKGYGRMQGIVTRTALTSSFDFATSLMINRNAGSGTRWLIDRFLKEKSITTHPAGYAYEANSHNAVAAAVAQGRADWGITLESVATLYGLPFEPLQKEQFDFVVPKSHRSNPAVDALAQILEDSQIRAQLRALGFDR